MKTAPVDWQAKLTLWRQTHPTTIPADLRAVREQFIQRFPKERLGELTLEQYAQGHGDHENFCYWLEFKTQALGSIKGGAVSKFGIWWSSGDNAYRWNEKLASTPEDAFARIKNGLQALIAAVDAGDFTSLDQIGDQYLPGLNTLRSKPLTLYYPDAFLPVNSGAHLNTLLQTFGLTPQPGLLARNRQLFMYLRSRLEFVGFDSYGIMRFFYDVLPPGDTTDPIVPLDVPSGEEGDSTTRIWKVAPGANARYWEMCREHQCIVMHWLDDVDFRTFADKAAVREALKQAGGGGGGAAAIWNFTHTMQPGQIIVANKGEKTVVGVGVITSDYIPPADPANPSTDARYRHTRRVDWRITEPVEVPFAFAQQTITPLSAEQWQQVRNAYLLKNPDLASVLAALDDEGGPPLSTDVAAAIEKIIPDATVRKLCLTALADSIVYAHQQGLTNWAACLPDAKANSIRLNVAGMEAINISTYTHGGLGYTLDSTAFTADLRSVVEQANVTINRNYDSNPPAVQPWIVYQVLPALLPQLHEAHQEFIKKVAEGSYRSNPNMRKSPHSPQVLAFLREYLGRPDLPNPTGVVGPPLPPTRTPPPPSPRLPAPPAEIARLLDLAGRTRNILLYGPPGTGKTWTVLQFARYFLADEGAAVADRMRFVTFHQSFAYEEFVEGLRPVLDADSTSGIRFTAAPGIFRQMCETAGRAWEDHQKAGTGGEAPRFLLVIDEINRANIAKVFGELITLIEDDKRLGQPNAVTVTLPYSGKPFSVPPNLWLLGTLNTADRSIALLDLALRRRFAFYELPPNPTLVAPARHNPVPGLDLGLLLARLNERIAALLDRDHRLGHSYFLAVHDPDGLHFAWYHRVIPLLEEYFYNDGARLRAVLGPVFVQPVKVDPATQKALGELYEGESIRYDVQRLTGAPFIAALQTLATGSAPVLNVEVTTGADAGPANG